MDSAPDEFGMITQWTKVYTVHYGAAIIGFVRKVQGQWHVSTDAQAWSKVHFGRSMRAAINVLKEPHVARGFESNIIQRVT